MINNIEEMVGSLLENNLTDEEIKRIFLEVNPNQEEAPNLGEDLKQIMKNYYNEKYAGNQEIISLLTETTMKEIGNQTGKIYFVINSANKSDYVYQILYLNHKVSKLYPDVVIIPYYASNQCSDYCCFIGGSQND